MSNAERIASLLMQALKIPEEDRSHVSAFGFGNAASNREAITAWVASHMHEIDVEETMLRLNSMISPQSEAADHPGGTYGER
ncbi:hypothetical protein D6779_05150 [Candidatus Parcubacteria bacterium]|nr:MAG: hypothetical protein D6779_05150 [Candidatus Parcubacteria bacterium]